MTALVGRGFRRTSPEWRLRPALLGGFLGGLTHPLLDGVMHGDIRPFLPLSPENPLYRVVSLDVLHGVCVATGMIGLVLLGWRWLRPSETG